MPKRTPEEHLEYIRINHPDYYENYKAAMAGLNARPQWRRSNGEYVFIDEMNRFHLSGAANKLSRAAKRFVEHWEEENGIALSDVEKAKMWEDILPNTFTSLCKEMEKRKLAKPKNPW